MPKVRFKFLSTAPYGFTTKWEGLLAVSHTILNGSESSISIILSQAVLIGPLKGSKGPRIKTVLHRVGKCDHFCLNYLAILYNIHLMYVCEKIMKSHLKAEHWKIPLIPFFIMETFVLSIHVLQLRVQLDATTRVVSYVVEIKLTSDCKTTQLCGINGGHIWLKHFSA